MKRPASFHIAFSVLAFLAIVAACSSADTSSPPEQRSPTPSPTVAPQSPTPAGTEVLVGAGDIADCASDGAEATAILLDSIPGTVFTAGDNAYHDGTESQFADCYDPAWGRHRDRTNPAPGNHDYYSEDAAPYFNYFGNAAHEPGSGHYTYDLGDWHIIVLNSNCDEIGGCGPDSPQGQWLADDLATGHQCTLAYWHHPVITIGPHDDDEAGILPLWQLLYDAGADVVVNGHEHNYQRYLPLNRNADGVDEAAGIRLFVVGTGGRDITNADTDRAETNPGLEVWADSPGDGDGHDASFGVIKFSLSPGAYAWEFVPVAGETFTDSGTGLCH